MKDKINGIYSITNTINGKVYYGSSVDCERRWYQHKSSLNKNIHKNYHLQSSWNKCGKDAVCSFAEGDELRMMLMGLRRFTKYTNPPNVVGLRETIASKLIAENEYCF